MKKQILFGLAVAVATAAFAAGPPDFLSKYKNDLEALEKIAVAEVGYDKKKDAISGQFECDPFPPSPARIRTARPGSW